MCMPSFMVGVGRGRSYEVGDGEWNVRWSSLRGSMGFGLSEEGRGVVAGGVWMAG